MKTSPVALALPWFVLIAACSASKDPGVGADTARTEPEDAGTPDAAQSSAAVDPSKKDASPPPAAPLGECGAETTQDACVTCCTTKHEDGAGVYVIALIDCLCLAGNCAKDCAETTCNSAPRNPDGPCSTCISAKSAACAPSAMAACTPNPACVAFDVCVGQSGCLYKSN